MTTGNFSVFTMGWTALATGAMGLLALAFIILFFTIGQPFGTLNDICICFTAILSLILAWMLYPRYHGNSPLLSQVELVFALVGAIVVSAGSMLVISGITGWYLAGLYMAAGNAFLGLWLLGLNYSAQQTHSLSQGLVVFGIVVGSIMALGLLAVPGIVRGIDSWSSAPWYVNYVGQAGALGWLVLYPIWCIWLGRILLSK